MRHGSLFSGMGGFDLAAEWMGWENVFHCEWNEFGQKILKYYWPRALTYEDITKTDFTIHRGKIDILTGGFPCQPFSNAGLQAGIIDPRYLWPEMLRAIRESKPLAVVGENVTGILSMEQHEMFFRVDGRKLVRFEDHDNYEAIYSRQATMLVNDICEDLEKEGYDVQTFVIPAAGVNAPHRRDRVWFVAFDSKRKPAIRNDATEGEGIGMDMENGVILQAGREQSTDNTFPSNKPRITPNSNGTEQKDYQGKNLAEKGEIRGNEKSDVPGEFSSNGGASDSNSLIRERGAKRFKPKKEPQSSYEQFKGFNKFSRQNWKEFPTQSPICDGDDGFPPELDGITFPKWRNESIKAAGNAIVPQVAFEIFKAIELVL